MTTLKEAIAEAKTKRTIINGRIPNVLVWVMRKHYAQYKMSEVADIFGTTVGKVQYILNQLGFKSITPESTFSDEEIDLGRKWIDRHPYKDTFEPQIEELLDYLDEL